jgi:hypothetical protein
VDASNKRDKLAMDEVARLRQQVEDLIAEKDQSSQDLNLIVKRHGGKKNEPTKKTTKKPASKVVNKTKGKKKVSKKIYDESEDSDSYDNESDDELVGKTGKVAAAFNLSSDSDDDEEVEEVEDSPPDDDTEAAQSPQAQKTDSVLENSVLENVIQEVQNEPCGGHLSVLDFKSLDLPTYCNPGEKFAEATCMKCALEFCDNPPSKNSPLHFCPNFDKDCQAVLCSTCYNELNSKTARRTRTRK